LAWLSPSSSREPKSGKPGISGIPFILGVSVLYRKRYVKYAKTATPTSITGDTISDRINQDLSGKKKDVEEIE
jgi:hypothetical protein